MIYIFYKSYLLALDKLNSFNNMSYYISKLNQNCSINSHIENILFFIKKKGMGVDKIKIKIG